MKNKNPLAAEQINTRGDDVTTWALSEGTIARLGRGSVRDMAFSPNGQYFAVGTSIGLWLYELPTLSPIALWDTERGMTDAVTFSPDNRRIVTDTCVEGVKIWDIERGACIVEIDNREKHEILTPVFSQDGRGITAIRYGRNGKICVWCSCTGTQLSETKIGETYGIYPFRFSSDIRLLAGRKHSTDSDPESILVWHVETGEQISCFTEYPEKMDNLCFSPDGKYLTAGSSNGTIRIWDIENGQLETTHTGYGDTQIFPYYSPEDGLIAAAVSERNVKVWHIERDEKIDTFEHRGNSRRACFLESGKQLAVASRSEIQIWTKGNNSDSHIVSTLHGHIPTMDTLVFSADEKTLAAGFWRDNVLLWDLASRHSCRLDSEKLPGTSHNVYLSDSGKIISTSVDETTLKIWEVGNREPIAELAKPEAGLLHAEAFASNGYRLARVDRKGNIHVWKCTPSSDDTCKNENWKKHATLVGHAAPANQTGFSRQHIVGMAFSPDGKRLASIARDCTAYLWDVNVGRQVTQLLLTPSPTRGTYREYDTGIAFSPLGDVIAGGKWGEIVFWSATDGKTLMTLPQPDGSQRPITLCFSPCGQYLASGAWWQPGLQKVPIRLWKVATGENIATFWGHTTDVQCFAFSKDNTLLVSGGHDGAIYLWDLTLYL